MQTLIAFLFTLLATVAIAQAAPPSTPSGLTGQQGSCLCADLAWNASIDDVTPQAQLVYDVNRNGADLHRTGPGETSYQDQNLTAGQTYTYKVRAVDADGFASPYSTPVQVSIVGGCE